MTVQLRPYQVEQVENVMRLLALGHRSVMIEAATGTGKTNTSGELARIVIERGGRALFLAHRGELLTQAARRFAEVFKLTVGIEQGSKRAIDEQVVCASVQTLRGQRLESWSPDAFDIIVIDECHHAPSASYRAITDYFRTARVVGVTATVDRADGVSLGEVFEEVAHRYGIDRAIDEGYLCHIQGVQVTVPGLDLSKVRQRRQMVGGSRERPGETIDLLAPAGQARVAPGGGARYSVDLHPGDLRAAALAPAAVTGIVGPMLELAGDRRTIVFAVDIPHAEAIAAEVNRRRPGAARVVHGKLKKKERAEIQAGHQRGDYQFMVNCQLLTEGYDDPAVACVVMARPTMSRVFYVQAVGRALRLHAGKTRALLIDFVGVGCKFNLVGPADALGKALVGLARVTSRSRRQVRRSARAVAAPAQEEPMPELALALSAPAKYTTKIVDLVRRAKKRVVSWFSKLMGDE